MTGDRFLRGQAACRPAKCLFKCIHGISALSQARELIKSRTSTQLAMQLVAGDACDGHARLSSFVMWSPPARRSSPAAGPFSLCISLKLHAIRFRSCPHEAFEYLLNVNLPDRQAHYLNLPCQIMSAIASSSRASLVRPFASALRVVGTRRYAQPAATPPPSMPASKPYEVFDRNTKRMQKDRAAINAERSRTVDYLRAEVAERLFERFEVSCSVF